jgi:hypothetical protein
VQVILQGRYAWNQDWDEVSYCRTFIERKVPDDILEPLKITAHAFGVVSLQAGAQTLPLPIQALAIPREELEITVAKRGTGVQIYYQRKDQLALSLIDFKLRFRAMLWDNMSVVFGTGSPVSNEEISERFGSITASWFEGRVGPSWQVNLSAQPKTSELGGEIYADVLIATDDSWEGSTVVPGIPSCEAWVPIRTVATKLEEAEMMIKYAWATDWPIKGTLAVVMDEGMDTEFEFSVTYQLEKQSEPTWGCLWARMSQRIIEDGIILPASVGCERLDYLASCEKVNQSIRILWKRGHKSVEDHGLPVHSIFGSNVEIKLRDIENQCRNCQRRT